MTTTSIPAALLAAMPTDFPPGVLHRQVDLVALDRLLTGRMRGCKADAYTRSAAALLLLRDGLSEHVVAERMGVGTSTVRMWVREAEARVARGRARDAWIAAGCPLPAPVEAKPREKTRRSKKEMAARETLARRSGGRCEAGCGGAATHWCARVQIPRKRLRVDPANGVHLCAKCMRHVSVAPDEAAEKGWKLPKGTDPTTARVFLVAHGGWVWLDPEGGVRPAEPVGVAA